MKMKNQRFFKDFGEWYLSKQFLEKNVFNKYVLFTRNYSPKFISSFWEPTHNEIFLKLLFPESYFLRDLTVRILNKYHFSGKKHQSILVFAELSKSIWLINSYNHLRWKVFLKVM